MGILEQIQKELTEIKKQNKLILEMLNKVQSSEPEIVNIDGLIKYRPFLKSKSKVYALVNKREIPFYKQGRNLIFKLKEVDEFLTSNKLKTV